MSIDSSNMPNSRYPFERVLEFVHWVKQMKDCPVDRVFFRPYSIEDQSHLNDLPMIRKFPSTERLKKAYKRAWRAYEIDILDAEGQKYWETPVRY